MSIINLSIPDDILLKAVIQTLNRDASPFGNIFESLRNSLRSLLAEEFAAQGLAVQQNQKPGIHKLKEMAVTLSVNEFASKKERNEKKKNIDFAHGYGFDHYSLSALNYLNKETLSVPSLRGMLNDDGFSFGNFAFYVDNGDYSISLNTASIKIEGYAQDISPKKRRSCLLLYFIRPNLKQLRQEYYGLTIACYCPDNHIELLAAGFPMVFVCRVCGKTYTCSCFLAGYSIDDLQYLDGWTVRNLLIHDANGQIVFDSHKRTSIKGDICHLHHEPIPALPLGLVENSYGLFFARQKGFRLSENNTVSMRDSVNKAREYFGYKKIGEAWVNETLLYRIVQNIFPDDNVIHHYRAGWLGNLELDVYVERANIGFEYQGIQHFKAQKQWGGKEALERQKKRDAEKKRLCAENGTTLIEVLYTENLTVELVLQKLNQ